MSSNSFTNQNGYIYMNFYARTHTHTHTMTHIDSSSLTLCYENLSKQSISINIKKTFRHLHRSQTKKLALVVGVLKAHITDLRNELLSSNRFKTNVQ